jgi:hypothetical protein
MGEVQNSLKSRIAAPTGPGPSGCIFGKEGPFLAGKRFSGTSRRGMQSPAFCEETGSRFLSVFPQTGTQSFCAAGPAKIFFTIIV